MPPQKVDSFDVRPLLSRGEEPFAALRRRVESLEAGHGLAVNVDAPHLPEQLVDLLVGNLLNSQVGRRTDGRWQVTFWRP